MVILFLVLLYFLQINQDCECKAIETVVSKCLIERITKSIKVLGEDKDIIGCIPCQPCPPGQEPYLACGSVISMKYISEIRCSSCLNGTYSDSYSRSSCKACKKCDRESIEVGKCTPSTNTVCLPRKSHCKRGFYFSEIVSVCLPCSRCCGDSKDIKIDECVTQGSQSKKLCSIHSIHRCSKDSNITTSTPQSVGKRVNFNFLYNTDATFMRTTSTTPANNRSNIASWRNKKNNLRKYGTKESSLPMISLGVFSIFVLVLISIILVFKLKSTSKNPEAGCFSMRLTKSNKNILLSDKCKSDQSDELEDWSSNDVSNSTYLFQCGVHVKYQPHSKQDRYKSLIVEALSEQAMDSHFRSIKPGQVFLSPIYRFYTQGEKFEEPVKISLPHSALYTSDQENWDVEILCMDERKGKEAKWERITDGLEVNWKDASFHTDTLLTYAVVGTPLKGAKKRMQFVLFTTSEMISDLFEVCIHLLDDNETSFQNVLKENSSKGFTMLGSFYAAFVDCHSSVNIDLNVEGLVDGWELNRLKPKTIPSSDCKESYFSIPSFQAAFRRVKRHADKFSCKFRIDVGGTEIIIPAFTFVPEEELCVVVDVHEQDHDTSVLKEKKTPFKDLHYDTKYVLGRMLDVSVKGQGTWRQLGRHFRLTDDELEQFSVEYRTLEGSPSRALFEYLSKTQPRITVGEFAKCLESLKREDVMAVLYKHLKKKPLNT